MPVDELLTTMVDAIAERDAHYMEVYSAYVLATHASMEAMIAMVCADGAPATIDDYRQAMSQRMSARKALDDAQIERISGAAMYSQVVRLLEEEIIVKLAETARRVSALELKSHWSAEP